jgi:hypothetical protein
MMFNPVPPATGCLPALPDPMKRRETLTRFARVVDDDATLASWNERRLREEALLRAVRRQLPRPVAERVFVASGESATLELSTSAGAIASVVRQRGPDLVAALRRDGFEFSGLRIRVQPQSMPMSWHKTVPRQWNSASRQPLVALASRLADGPLKAALARLLKGR